MTWIYILTVCAGFSTCNDSELRTITSPDSFGSLGACISGGYVAEQVLKTQGQQVVEAICEQVKVGP